MAKCPLVERPKDRVIDYVVGPRNFSSEFDNRGSACRDKSRLNVMTGYRGTSVPIDISKLLADDMKRRYKVRSDIADVESYSLAHSGSESVLPEKSPNLSVEHNVGWLFFDSLLKVELLQPFLPELACCVELALHDAVFLVDGRKIFLWLDKNEPIHSVGDVFGDRRHCTMINEQP